MANRTPSGPSSSSTPSFWNCKPEVTLGADTTLTDSLETEIFVENELTHSVVVEVEKKSETVEKILMKTSEVQDQNEIL